MRLSTDAKNPREHYAITPKPSATPKIARPVHASPLLCAVRPAPPEGVALAPAPDADAPPDIVVVGPEVLPVEVELADCVVLEPEPAAGPARLGGSA